MESKGGNCTICSEKLVSDSVAVTEDVLDLFKFLIATIDRDTLQKALICGICLEKINDAVNFKTSFLVKRENDNVETIQETDCDEKTIVICYICKNTTKPSSAVTLFDSCDETVINYMIANRDLDSFINLQICEHCQKSALNFQRMTLFLSVYDLNKTNNAHTNSESLAGENEFKIEIVDNCLSEDSRGKISITNEFKREIETDDFQIKQELDLKMDVEPGPSNLGFWNLYNDDQEGSSSYLQKYVLDQNNINDVKVFKCQYCQYQAKRKNHLQKHTLIHKNINEVEMFKCKNCVPCDKVTITRKELFLLIKDDWSSVFSKQIDLLEQKLSTMNGCPFKISNMSKKALKLLFSKMKTKWRTVHRYLQTFYYKNKDWLGKNVIIENSLHEAMEVESSIDSKSSNSRRLGRPSLDFASSSNVTKLRKL